jgi:flagellar biosynthesis chaperone FliJ
MNPKIPKLITEIERIRSKIKNLQTRLQELERQRIELENTDIIEMVRSVTATPEELAAFIKTFSEQSGTAIKLIKQEE